MMKTDIGQSKNRNHSLFILFDQFFHGCRFDNNLD